MQTRLRYLHARSYEELYTIVLHYLKKGETLEFIVVEFVEVPTEILYFFYSYEDWLLEYRELVVGSLDLHFLIRLINN